MEHVHLLGSLGPPLRVALFWPDRGAKFMEETFPRLVQTGEGSSVNSSGSQFMEKTIPQLGQMGEGSSIDSIPNKIHHRMLETRAMVKF